MSTLSTTSLGVSINDHTLLDDVTISFTPKRLHLVIGPNGAGKSTLLKTMLGLLSPQQGAVQLDHTSIHAMPDAARAASLSYMPQHLDLFFESRVVDFIELARFAFDEAPAVTQQHIDRSLAAVGAVDLKYARFDTLSGGERQRVMLAACLAQDAPYLLLDEPDASLDPAHQIALKQLITKILAQGPYTLILVTHHWNPYLDLQPQIHALKRGQHLFTCEADQLHGQLTSLFDCDFVEWTTPQQSWSLPKYS